MLEPLFIVTSLCKMGKKHMHLQREEEDFYERVADPIFAKENV
jgi:hypothetical protein